MCSSHAIAAVCPQNNNYPSIVHAYIHIMVMTITSLSGNLPESERMVPGKERGTGGKVGRLTGGGKVARLEQVVKLLF